MAALTKAKTKSKKTVKYEAWCRCCDGWALAMA